MTIVVLAIPIVIFLALLAVGAAILAAVVRIPVLRAFVGVAVLGLLAVAVVIALGLTMTLAIAGGRAHAPPAEAAPLHGNGQAALPARPAARPSTDASPAQELVGKDEQRPLIQLDREPAHVVIPPRPPWVESEPVLAGPVHTIAVSSGPEENERDCRRALNRELEKALDGYIDQYLGPVLGGRFKASRFIHYRADEIKRRLVKEEYHEVVQVSFGPMHQMHALLALDRAFRDELDRRRGELVAMSRLGATGLGLAFVLALLAVMFGYLRLDTATRGNYTRRLQLAAAVVILGLIAAGAFLARQMPW